jgi:hypothetical protein
MRRPKLDTEIQPRKSKDKYVGLQHKIFVEVRNSVI